MRRTLTIDEDVDKLLERENRRANEPMKQTINRMLRSGLAHSNRPVTRKRFIVKPFDTSLTSEHWKSWGEAGLEDVLEEAVKLVAR